MTWFAFSESLSLLYTAWNINNLIQKSLYAHKLIVIIQLSLLANWIIVVMTFSTIKLLLLLLLLLPGRLSISFIPWNIWIIDLLNEPLQSTWLYAHKSRYRCNRIKLKVMWLKRNKKKTYCLCIHKRGIIIRLMNKILYTRQALNYFEEAQLVIIIIFITMTEDHWRNKTDLLSCEGGVISTLLFNRTAKGFIENNNH